jgi:hypothetical protein
MLSPLNRPRRYCFHGRARISYFLKAAFRPSAIAGLSFGEYPATNKTGEMDPACHSFVAGRRLIQPNFGHVVRMEAETQRVSGSKFTAVSQQM